MAAAAPEAPPAIAPMTRKFFLVFDFAFMDPKSMLRARSAALEFLGGDLQPNDELGVVSFQIGRGLVLHEYLTTDHARVRSIVEGFGAKIRAGRAENLTQFIYSSDMAVAPPPGSKAAGTTVPDPENQFYEGMARAQAGQSIGSAGRQSYVDQARQFLIALGQMAKVLRNVPGFKNILLFSGGISRQYLYGKRGGAVMGEWTTPEQLAAQLGTYDGAQASGSLRDDHSAMIKEFKASNCPVYTIDVSRERTEGDVQTMTGVSGAGLREFEGADSLRQVASGTGGKFYAKTMAEGRIAEDIRSSTSAYYVLGYAVEDTFDGKFHKIKVAVKRKGVDVVTQGGYFSAKPFKDFTRFEKLMHIVDVALGETPDTQVPYDIPVTALPLTVKGWPQALVFARASQAVLSDVLGKKSEAYLLLMDEKGDLANINRFPLAVDEPGGETLYPSFLLRLKPGRYACRMVVRNSETGRAARGTSSLTVPPEKVSILGLDPPFLAAPEAGSRELPASPDGSAAKLFGYDPAAFAPFIGDIPAGTTKLHAGLRVQGGAASKGLTVTASLIDAAAAARFEAPVAILRQSDDGPTRLFFVELSTPELKPGRYTLVVEVKEPATGERAVSSGEFTVR
ncbi:MAG: VWA domain-containing protein [Candidatus Aminicenantes bacterium]|nr:VWA domain-containing protein [Candidatus Aminicenantes bacterium]